LQILWTEGAKRNLVSIEAYIALDNSRAAAKTVVTIVRKIQKQLAEFPGSGKSGRSKGTMELIFTGLPYIAVYTVRDNSVFILRVFHTAQKLE